MKRSIVPSLPGRCSAASSILPLLGLLALVLVFPLLTACGGAASDDSGAGQGSDATAPDAPLPDAAALAREVVLVDTHVDVPYRLVEEMADISQATESGDFDYPRAVAGGLDAPFMSIYVPASFQETGGAKEHADRLIDLVEGFETDHPDKFAVVRTPDELLAVAAEGKIALPLGMENGAPIEGDLANLAHFHERGIRYITLTHSENNHICDSSYADERQWHGLSPFGREVVAEMNRLGIMIDVSHISDDTFDQVMELTRAPVIATHSSCRHFTPGFERNLSDDQIRRLAAAGGVVAINFGSAFLTEEANRYSRAMWDAVGAFTEEHGLGRGDPEVEAFIEQYRQENPYPYATLEDVVAHIDHVVQLTGVDHVGIGSDYDGVGDSLPTGLKDVSDYPNLLQALLDAGYSRGDVEKIWSGNVLRVWRQVEEVAERLQDDGADDADEPDDAAGSPEDAE